MAHGFIGCKERHSLTRPAPKNQTSFFIGEVNAEWKGYRLLKMKSNLFLALLLCTSVFGDESKIDTATLRTYSICKINSHSVFHKYHATLFAKSKFDSLKYFFGSRISCTDTSIKNINTLSGGLFAEANNYMTDPIIQKTNEIIENYCKKNKIDTCVTYSPYGIQYANGETNYYPTAADSVYILTMLENRSIPDVTDTIIQLLNEDLEIMDIREDIDKAYKSYKKKIKLKLLKLLKNKNQPRVRDGYRIRSGMADSDFLFRCLGERVKKSSLH